MGETIITEAGTFSNCVSMLETTPLEPGSESTKTYCHGVGLVIDNQVSLIDYSFAMTNSSDDAEEEDDEAEDADAEGDEDEVDDDEEGGDEAESEDEDD